MKRLITYLLVCATTLCLVSGAAAAVAQIELTDWVIRDIPITADASDYLAAYSASTSRAGSGKLQVNFEITATTIFPSVGSSRIEIQERSGSSWTTVMVYTNSSTSSMMGSNTNRHFGNITYNGIAGREYRARVTAFAGGSSGSDSKIFITGSTIV